MQIALNKETNADGLPSIQKGRQNFVPLASPEPLPVFLKSAIREKKGRRKWNI